MTDVQTLVAQAIAEDPVVEKMSREEPTWWWNAPVPSVQETLDASSIPAGIVDEAAARFRRFAPWMRAHFSDSLRTGGVLESPLVHETGMVRALNDLHATPLQGNLWFKRDDSLPVSGSVKARGGIHEVLEVAERIAHESGLLALDDDYRRLDEGRIRALFAEHGITVGSTGNLGLSIGLLAAELGFSASVHMSADAKAWKKALLRTRGATVIEHEGDFSEAVDAGRALAAADPSVHFVDDEGSLSLFAGYAVAGRRLAGQLRAFDVPVDVEHPLFVYLPCGVGGAPGGITYGLKQVFGEHVHCIFVEPVGAPAMTLGVRMGLHDRVSAHDLGLPGRTAADGLAVSRPSRLVGEALGNVIDGFVTLRDDTMLASLALLERAEGFTVEPSAAAGMTVPWIAMADAEFLASRKISERQLAQATHIVWCTGGSMVPEAEMSTYLAEGRRALEEGAIGR